MIKRIKLRLRKIISKLRVHKRATIIVLASLLFLAIAVSGLLLSERAWSDYETSYNGHFDSAKTDIDKAISQTLSKTSTNLTDKLNNIIQIQAKLTADAKIYCETSSLIGWQSFIGKYSDKIKNCQQQKENLGRLLVSLDEITGYLKAEQQLAAIISVAGTKTDQNNQADKWNKIEAFWRQATTDASKLPDTNQFKPVKTLAVNGLTKVADTWKQLSSANDAKNRQQFEEAHSNLNLAYTSLVAISDSSKAETVKLVASLNDNYGKAF